MSVPTWRSYGGINNLENTNNLIVNNISAGYLTLRYAYAGLFTVSGDIMVSGNAYFATRCLVGGALSVAGPADISGAFLARSSARVYGNILMGSDVSAGFFYGTGGNVALNGTSPMAALDITSNTQDCLALKSTLRTTRSILARNSLSHGITVAADDASACLQFFEASAIAGPEVAGDAVLRCHASGTLDVSADNISLLARTSISARGEGAYVRGETLVVYDVSSGDYLKDLFPDTIATTGSALSLVATGSAANTALSIITPGGAGLGVLGGANPGGIGGSMGSLGLYDASGTYMHAQTMMVGSSSTKLRTSLGINTCVPTIDMFALEVNGPVYIHHGEVLPVLHAPVEITAVSMRKGGVGLNAIGMAVGSPCKKDLSTASYTYGIYHTEDYGQHWTLATTAPVSTNLTLRAVQVYDNMRAIAAGDGGLIMITCDKGVTWTKLLGSTITGDIVAVGMFDTSNASYYSAGLQQTVVVFGTASTLYFFQADSINEIDMLMIQTATLPSVLDTSRCTSIYSINAGVGTIYSIDVPNNNYVFVCGNNGVQRLPLGAIGALNMSVVANNTLRQFIYASPGSLFSSGTIMASATHYATASLYGSKFAVFVGAKRIAYTTDGITMHQSDISAIPYGDTIVFTAAAIVDASNAIVAGYSASYKTNFLCYTVNGAASWAQIPDFVLNTNGYLSDLTKVPLSLTSVYITNSDTFSVAGVYSAYGSTSILIKNGSSKIYNCFLPDLFNKATHKVLSVLGVAAVSGNVLVGGDAVVSGSLLALADSSLNGNLVVGKLFTALSDASLNGNLVVSKLFTALADASLNGNLVVGLDASLNGKLTVNKLFAANADASLNGNLMVGGGAGVGGNVYVGGNISVAKNAVVTGTAFALGITTGSIFITGGAVINSLLTAGRITLSTSTGTGELIVGGVAGVSGVLTVKNTTISTSSGSGALTVSGGAGVGGNVYVGGRFVACADASLNFNLAVGLDASLNGGLVVGGSLSALASASVAENLVCYGTLKSRSLDCLTSDITSTLNVGATSELVNIAPSNSGVTKIINVSQGSGGAANQINVGRAVDSLLLTGNITLAGPVSATAGTIQLLSGASGSGNSAGAGLLIRDGENNSAGFVKTSADMTGFLLKAANNSAALNLSVANLALRTDATTGRAMTHGLVMFRTTSVGDSTSAYTIDTLPIDASSIMLKNYTLSSGLSNTQILSSSLGVTGDVSVTSTSVTTGAATGALVVAGGAAVGNNLYVSGNATVDGNLILTTGGLVFTNNVFFRFNQSAISPTTGTVSLAGGLGTGGDNYLGGNTIISGRMSVISTTASTSSSTGALVVSGGAGIVGNLRVAGALTVTGMSVLSGNTTFLAGAAFASDVELSGLLRLTASTTSTSSASGALVVTAGVGVGENLFVGGALNISGPTTLISSAVATSISSGALVVTGGTGVGGNLFVGGVVTASSLTIIEGAILGGAVGLTGNAVISGNLSVNNIGFFRKISEAITSVQIDGSTGTILAVDYAASAAVIYASGNVNGKGISGNITCAIINVPTNVKYKTYTLSVIIPSSSCVGGTPACITSVSVNGNVSRVLFNGGFQNNLIIYGNVVIQQLSIIMTESATIPALVVSSIGSYY